MDLDKRRQLIESYLSLGGPPPGDEILSDTERDEIRRARELNLDPALEAVNESGGPLFDYTPLMSLIETFRGRNSGFNVGPIYCDGAFDGGRLCRMRPAEAYRELLVNARRLQLGPVATVDARAFFDGNYDAGSIGAALDGGKDSFAAIRDSLLALARLPAVKVIGIEIVELPNLNHEGDNDVWPQAGRA